MLSDHELEILHLDPRGKYIAKNLAYVHKRCAQLNGMEFLPYTYNGGCKYKGKIRKCIRRK